MVKPIFIVSLPRAGSTLLQRLLMGHPQIGTCGEPWLALPIAYLLRENGVITEYGARSAGCSIRQFASELPGGVDEFWKQSAAYLSGLYASKAPDGVELFVDKTPRYYKILPELRQMFPEAPIVLLVRNPLAVFASMLNFVKGDLRYMPMWKNDWMDGHCKIAEALSTFPNFSLVRYEALVSTPNESMKALMGELGLEFDEQQVEGLSGQRLGRGDPTGVNLYKSVDTAPLTSWKQSIDTPTKKRMAMRWLRVLPESVCAMMGYSKLELIEELSAHRPAIGVAPIDCLRLFVGTVYFSGGLHILKRVLTRQDGGCRPFYN